MLIFPTDNPGISQRLTIDVRNHNVSCLNLVRSAIVENLIVHSNIQRLVQISKLSTIQMSKLSTVQMTVVVWFSSTSFT
jgi:hypothetical protein